YLINEVKTKVGEQETLVIGYDEAKKLGVQKDVRHVYIMTTPLPMEERMENVEDWRKHGVKLVLSTKISEAKYRKMVEKILIKKWGKP
ncbi:unnamed protein product, partial [marine sediment metagenome]